MPNGDLRAHAVTAAQRYGLDGYVFLAMLNYESGFQNIPGASGEMGPGQFMPGTWSSVIDQHPEIAQEFGVTRDPADRANAVANVFAAAAHLSDLLADARGDYHTALAAYNGGWGGRMSPAAQSYATTVLGAVGAGEPYTGPVGPVAPGAPGTLNLGQLTPEQLQYLFGEDGAAGRTLEEDIEYLREQHRLAIERGDHERAADFANRIAELQIRLGFQREERIAGQVFERQERRRASLDALLSQLADLQVQARTEAIESIGRDPFRGALRAQGAVPIGRSPFGRLQRELRGFAEAELPSVGPYATTPEIEAGIAQAGELIGAFPERPFGMQRGGVLDMERGLDGTFAVRDRGTGRVGESILVGEAGPEYLQFNEDGTIRVTPASDTFRPRRVAGSAQFGGEYDFGGEALMRAQVLAPLYGALGLDRIPLVRRAPAALGGVMLPPLAGTGRGLPTPADPSIFGAIGTRPRLVWEPNREEFLFVSGAGEVQRLGSPERAVRDFGIDPSDAITATREELQAMGFGRDLRVRTDPLLFEGRGRFAEMAPIVAPLREDESVGVLLPDLRLIASIWNELDPATQRAVVSVYGTAEVGGEELESRIGFFTPRGIGPRATARLR